MSTKNNESQKLRKVSENYDLTALINFLTDEVYHLEVVKVLKEIEYQYFDYLLNDKESGLPLNVGNQHFYLHRLITVLEQITVKE